MYIHETTSKKFMLKNPLFDLTRVKCVFFLFVTEFKLYISGKLSNKSETVNVIALLKHLTRICSGQTSRVNLVAFRGGNVR